MRGSHNNDDSSSSSDHQRTVDQVSPGEIIRRIEKAVEKTLEMMHDDKMPAVQSLEGNCLKRFNLAQSRSFTSTLLVMSYCHNLLIENRSATTREVYYFFVTHFRSQRESDNTIREVSDILQVSRTALGLAASPKGWFCGLLKIIRDGNVTDAQAQPSMQGLPITREWLYSSQVFRMQSSAKCILVVEKEGIYNRLVEDRIFDRFPCILVTGKGFPDLATRALVSRLHQYFALPVYGICDCNPYGVSVLSTFQKGSKKKSLDRDDSYGVPIMWLGLKPSVVQKLQLEKRLPLDVFQQMTEFDRKRLRSLCVESHHFHNHGSLNSRLQELEIMRQLNYKVELEALHWMGMNYICDWLEDVLRRHDLGEAGLII